MILKKKNELQNIICETYKAGKNYSDKHKNGNRSKKRTDMLNAGTIKLLEHVGFHNYVVLEEKQKPCARGSTFTIDLVLADKTKTKRKRPNINILLKSIESSYNKNRHNYANGIVGETWRVYGAKQNKSDITVFINYIPETIPVKDRKGNIKSWEDPKISDDSRALELLSGGRAFVINAVISKDLKKLTNLDDVINKLQKIKKVL